MIDFLLNYGLFLAKTFTLCIAILITLAIVLVIIQKNKALEGTFVIQDINERLDDVQASFENETMPKRIIKQLSKQRKKEAKLKKKEEEKARLFVINFEGDIRASQTDELREVITAVLTTATPQDEVFVIVDSAGGFVHQYGLAASQLKRIRDHDIPLTVGVDKLAASGGYLMACVANKIIAAPFAVVGSIGVLGQMPNFHKLLNKHNIDFEQHTAGEYKRSITMFGENTDKDRKKFQEDLELTHTLFKEFIDEHRPQVDLSKVATGEHWHAVTALHLNLIDTIMTSDDYIISHHPKRRIFEVSYVTKHNLKDKLSSSFTSLLQKGQDALIKFFNK